MSRRRADIVVLLLELASSCGEGSRLTTAGDEGLQGILSGNYRVTAGLTFQTRISGVHDLKRKT